MNKNKYGITKTDLINFQNRHDIQRNYMSNHTFVGSTGQVKSLLDISHSANHSSRYYAELINKINTVDEIVATELMPYDKIFMTITLDGFFRDFLKGNFSRYKENIHKKLIPNNERFGHLRDKISGCERFTIKDLYNVLNFQLNRFQKSKNYTKIKKTGYKAHYIRVAEPHKKDGVPHLHMMLYVPVQFRTSLLETFKEYFPAPQNIKKLKDCKKGQLNGFQWEIESAPAYILKYLFKSFLDVENETKLDELQTWYMKHRILRVVTSHSLVPAWVYRKVIPLEKDWHYLTDIKNNSIFESSKEDDYFMFEDEHKRVLRYEKGIYQLFNKDRLIKEFGTKKELKEKVDIKFKLTYKKRKVCDIHTKKEYIANIYFDSNNFMQVNKTRVCDLRTKCEYTADIYFDDKYLMQVKSFHDMNSNIKIIINDEEFVQKDTQFVKVVNIPSRMSDIGLERYYRKLKLSDISITSSAHFKVTKNEMIKRGLLNNKKEIVKYKRTNNNLSEEIEYIKLFGKPFNKNVVFDRANTKDEYIKLFGLPFSKDISFASVVEVSRVSNSMDSENLVSLDESLETCEYGF